MTMLGAIKFVQTALSAAVVAVALSFASPATAATQGSGVYPKLFGSREFRSSKLTKFRKWNDVIDRYQAGAGKQRRKCRVSKVNRCMNQKWQTFLKKIGSRPLHDQINKVNTLFQ